MRILIVPSFSHAYQNSALLAAETLYRACQSREISAALCVHAQGRFHDMVTFPAPALENFSRRPYEQAACRESDLYATHETSSRFLNRDLKAIRSAIRSFHPDIVLDLGRPCAGIAARLEQVPCWGMVSSAYFKNLPFASACLNGLNRLLHDHQLEQVLHLSDLYRYEQKLFTFGLSTMQPFPASQAMLRYGSMFPERRRQSRENLVIVLGESSLPVRKLQKIILQAFNGASYQVIVYLAKTDDEAQGNITFTSRLDDTILSHARAVIYDGNLWVFNLACSLGVPQLVFSNSGWQRARTAAAVQRMGVGLARLESELSMEMLYESYRLLLSHDRYEENALINAAALAKMKSLQDFLNDLQAYHKELRRAG
jgi:UDP:flavonoid glycosyltransferase YjiC (YdhE family)